MPFIGSRWVPGPGEPLQAPQRVGSQVVPSTPQAQPAVQPQPSAAPSPSPGLIDPGTGVTNLPQPTTAPATSIAQPAQNWTSAQREQFKNQWMGTGTNVQAQNALLAQHGLTPDAAGRVTLPTGEQLDLRIGAKSGQNLAGWTRYAGAQAVKKGQAGGGGGGIGGVGGIGGGRGAGGIGGQGTIGGPGGGQDIGGGIREAIMQTLRGAQQPIDVDALNASPESQAFRRVMLRELAANRAQAAESAAARGVGVSTTSGAGQRETGGALQSGIGRGQEALAERMQAFQSQLVGREMQNRRDQLMQSLQLGAGVMGRDQEAALRRELAALDANLRKMGISSQERIAGQQLSTQQRLAEMANELGFANLNFGRERAYGGF